MSTINVDIIDAQSAETVLVNGVSINKNGTGTIQLNGAAVESTALNAVIIGADTGIIATAFPNGNDACVLIGHKAGKMTSSGANNVMIGAQAGTNNTTGYSNLFIGSNAGQNNTTGFSNLFIGQMLGDTIYNSFTGDNNISIDGLPSSSSVSGSITLGNTSHTVLRCNVTSITSLSDSRDKKDITELPVGLDFINTLKPVSFVWNERDEKGKHDIKDFGFIAQDLKKAQEDAKLADTLKLVYDENPEKLEASYGKLVPILVKAIQDLSAKVTELEDKLK
jgi:hypothetical protein